MTDAATQKEEEDCQKDELLCDTFQKPVRLQLANIQKVFQEHFADHPNFLNQTMPRFPPERNYSSRIPTRETLLYHLCKRQDIAHNLDILQYLFENNNNSRNGGIKQAILNRNAGEAFGTPLLAACSNQHVSLPIIQLLMEHATVAVDKEKVEIADGGATSAKEDTPEEPLLPLESMILNAIYNHSVPNQMDRIKYLLQYVTEEYQDDRIMDGGKIFRSACFFGAPAVPVLELLLQTWPKCCTDGLLHQFLDHTSSWSSDTTVRAKRLELILYLLDRFPEQARDFNAAKGGLLLHRILGRPDWVDTVPNRVTLIQKLVRLYPESLNIPCSPRDLWSYYSYEHSSSSRPMSGCPLEIVMNRWHEFPAIIKALFSDCEQSGLWTAVQQLSDQQHDLIRIGQIFPHEAIQHNAETGQLPLHAFCERLFSFCFNHWMDEDFNVLYFLRKLNPKAVLTQDSNGDLPLHIACRRMSTNEIEWIGFETLYSKYEIIRALSKRTHGRPFAVPNNKGELPLHLLCLFPNFNRHKLKFYVEKNPNALWHRTQFGQMPIHYCLLSAANIPNDVDTKVLKSIIELLSFKPSASTHEVGGNRSRGIGVFSDDTGVNPVHLACRSWLLTKPEIMEQVLRHFPNCASEANTKGLLPLHVACSNPLVVEVNDEEDNSNEPVGTSDRDSCLIQTIYLLINANPNAATKRSNAGFLPLHYACLQKNPNASLIQLLLTHFPSALTKNCSGADATGVAK